MIAVAVLKSVKMGLNSGNILLGYKQRFKLYSFFSLVLLDEICQKGDVSIRVDYMVEQYYFLESSIILQKFPNRWKKYM